MRNLNQSQTYNKFKVKSNIESNSFRKARVSSKNVLNRFNPAAGGGNVMKSIQPLDELRGSGGGNFNYESRI